ncbi:MAG: type II toxin-antitoxin system Phd/YefM family antitoxin [Gemmatimonadales bacterium]
MRSVNIADLKNHLSRYLQEVREGQELVVRDRNLPFAKIVPISAASEIDPEDLALVASGQLRPPEIPLPASFWSMPAPRVSIKRAAAAVAADREGD